MRWGQIKCEATKGWVFVGKGWVFMGYDCLTFYFTEGIAKRLCRLSELCRFKLGECSIGDGKQLRITFCRGKAIFLCLFALGVRVGLALAIALDVGGMCGNGMCQSRGRENLSRLQCGGETLSYLYNVSAVLCLRFLDFVFSRRFVTKLRLVPWKMIV